MGLEEDLINAMNTNALATAEKIKSWLILPWPDQETDEKNCLNILFKNHPDGRLGPLIEDVEHGPHDTIQSIKLNKTVCEWMRYFSDKYGKNSGLFNRFMYEKIWDPILSENSKEN